jgi:hypothetical protein
MQGTPLPLKNRANVTGEKSNLLPEKMKRSKK